MISVLEYLDGLPWQPLALFGLAYLVFLVTVLAWFQSRRSLDVCDRCGGEWKLTQRGNAYHVCEERDPDLPHRLLSLSVRGANDPKGPTP